ncbi:fluoride efflux transporter CrcB [Rhizobiaceae bacterium BDR2-2]|uniref:Fluoride-specific ion channel FluC n=1 Tax=Ectorhizobium quercum TaxID=2965071 RepID=A0AAE3N346_9HYPH|nr:fluoride efflux transporter CrcB [Ectorhizobium quercum]MCX8997712.1 fluoride efflux transporter CrcB [Ectorhizobium quercum]
MSNILLVAAGGAVGSVLRYLTGVLALRLVGPGFPWGTLAVNIVGSYLIGCVAEALVRGVSAPLDLRLLLMTGLIGGFTTFSAFSLDLWVLYERGAVTEAMLYFTATVVLSLLATGAGLLTVRLVS